MYQFSPILVDVEKVCLDLSFKSSVGSRENVAVITIQTSGKTNLFVTNFKSWHQVRVVVTENAKHFFDLTAVPPTVMVYDDQAEWSWSRYGDPVVHIELRNWADVVVIAPLDANSLAKLALVSAVICLAL